MSSEIELGEEAAEWLLRLDETDPGPADEYADEMARNLAFYEWIGTSPAHLRVFLEMMETQQRMRLIDSRHRIKVDALLRHRAEVIPLHKEKQQRIAERPPASAPRETRIPMWRKQVLFARVAAAVLICVLGAGGYWWSFERNVYATQLGEQRSTKLEDGSFIYLNTDSKVEVAFSDQTRNVRLVRGEALFVVERDSSRPFTVMAGDTTVRALGTQFNVRRRTYGAEVAVVEGTVQVTAMDEEAGFLAQKLVAGEEAQVIRGKIAPRNRQAIGDAVAWRQRRLVFHDAHLADVAAEFNRYNRTKIRIEGDAAKELSLSGIFDADRPQALMLYVAQSSEFAVEPEGDDWVIRAR